MYCAAPRPLMLVLPEAHRAPPLHVTRGRPRCTQRRAWNAAASRAVRAIRDRAEARTSPAGLIGWRPVRLVFTARIAIPLVDHAPVNGLALRVPLARKHDFTAVEHPLEALRHRLPR